MDEKVRKRRWGRQPAYPLDCTAGFPVHASDEEEAALERQNVFLHRIINVQKMHIVLLIQLALGKDVLDML